ncbi:hypothetical protein OSB04_008458 [Centaurea solstitialis]|uniref:B box-type domain-containing protein n=1 Tax=Centaurea solstitialis TaxID=347529 RepID=A0AA38TUD3_9ASTR|nr:hypothetical protein OSB04_008458 [Centaurea solstitialis]
MVESLSSMNLPVWLESLLSEKFYDGCIIHQDSKKNEKNIFCVDCCQGLCPHCLTPHGSHRLLQIRRYVYHDVIRVGDAEKLMDCSYVQIKHILRSEGMMSEYLHECEVLTLPEPGFDDGLMTPDSVLEPFVSLRTSSGSSATGFDCRTIVSTATTEIVRKKRTSKSTIRSTAVAVAAEELTANRRKGVPRRSPFQ